MPTNGNCDVRSNVGAPPPDTPTSVVHAHRAISYTYTILPSYPHCTAYHGCVLVTSHLNLLQIEFCSLYNFNESCTHRTATWSPIISNCRACLCRLAQTTTISIEQWTSSSGSSTCQQLQLVVTLRQAKIIVIPACPVYCLLHNTTYQVTTYTYEIWSTVKNFHSHSLYCSTYYNCYLKDRAYSEKDCAYTYNFNQGSQCIPGVVTQTQGLVLYMVIVYNGETEWWRIDHLSCNFRAWLEWSNF